MLAFWSIHVLFLQKINFLVRAIKPKLYKGVFMISKFISRIGSEVVNIIAFRIASAIVDYGTDRLAGTAIALKDIASNKMEEVKKQASN